MKVHLANKILSGISAILSLLLGITSTWILTSLLIQKYGGGGEQEQQNCEPDHSWKYGATSSPCSSNNTHNKHSEFDEEAIIIENSKAMPTPKLYRMLTEFHHMSSMFYVVVIICLSCAIFASLLQLGCSLAVIFSPAYKIATRSRRTLVILFVSFVIFLTCFSWPIAYKREPSTVDDDDEYHTISTLNASVDDFLMNFELQDLLKDLTLYYFEIFANIIYLFFYMVTTCCLLRCNEDWQYYDV